ncbi:MAG: hypothetical protein LUH36_03245 [Oscillospiraceae bacterium]|nr:hypothetical protein [Oscillospiraceae bacterium]
MTLIEFFDRSPVKNLTGCLSAKADEIVFVGEQRAMEKAREPLNNILSYHGFDGPIRYAPIRRNSIDSILSVLSDIVETSDGCIFDLTGGEDLALFAAGQVYAKYQAENIHMQWFNLRTGRIADWGQGQPLYRDAPPSLSVDDNILLHGGLVVYDDIHPLGTHQWDLTPEFVRDIKTMWEICRRNCGLWNFQLTMLANLEKYSTAGALALDVDIAQAVSFAETHDITLDLGGIFPALAEARLLTFYDCSGGRFRLGYKNAQVKRCLAKAGTVLELVTRCLADELREKDGSPVFTDTLSGVYIDWDDIVHEPGDSQVDTQNEIDVILMRGLMPIFISCKNGNVGIDELYKLSAVADHFGRGFGKKVLVCASLEKALGNPAYFIDRAKSMDIELISDVQDMDQAAFSKRLRQLIS